MAHNQRGQEAAILLKLYVFLKIGRDRDLTFDGGFLVEYL